MDQATSQPVIKFGPYLVDMRAGELRKNGTRIRLQEKPLRVLAALAEQQGQVVTREELKKRLWPGDTFVDFETGLNTAVSKLREALSDNAEKPRYIETMPRRGYRFLAPVEIVNSNGRGAASFASGSLDGASSSGSRNITVSSAIPGATEFPAGKLGYSEKQSVEKQIERIRSASANWIRGTIAAAALLLAAVVWWLTPLADPRITDIFAVTQTGRQDYLVRPATDGARIFYVQRAGDHYDLMQASVNGGEAQKLDAPFPNTLVWDVSQDGSKYLITSFLSRGEPSPLWSWPATGGPPVKIGDITSGSATFSPDGKRIAYHLHNDLLTANTDGTGVRKLATFPDEPDSPVWSPDGLTIRFVRNDPQRSTGEIWEIAPDGRNLRPVLPGWQNLPKQCCGTWTPDGRYFIFVEYSQSFPRMYILREKKEWWRRSPRGPFLLAAEATGSWSPLVGRDGTRVYYYGIGLQSELQILDVATQQYSAVLNEKHAAMLSVSRDGQRVAYIQVPSGVLWTSGFDGSAPRQIHLPGMHGAFPRFSSDNKLIALTEHKDGEPENVYIVSAEGGTPQPAVPNVSGMSDPDWSPDGSRLVVDRDLHSQQPQQPGSALAFLDLKTSQITNVPGSEDLHQPRWSPDGRHIAAVGGKRADLRVFEISSRRWTTLATGKSLSYAIWTADSANLYYQDILAPGQPLYRVQVATGSQTLVASFQKVLDSGIQRCIFVALSPTGAPVMAFDRSYSDIYGARLLLP